MPQNISTNQTAQLKNITIIRLIKENIVKNILILFFSVIFYFPLFQALKQVQPVQLNDFLLILSMFIVAACFANFTFTYEKSNILLVSQRMFSHFVTFMFMLLLALLLDALVISVGFVYPQLYSIIFVFSILIYLSVALYDFWDILRAKL
ncbi:hypothetical protein HY636_05620 [Candidatus Woesearchaeota archaeon]|nr:hypothetical protein [Candidatus Woesearchaeota archaeon]